MTTHRFRDLAAYILIALAIGLSIVWYAYSGAPRDSDVIARWGGLVVNTIILYGYVIKESKPFWHVCAFWLALSCALAAHLLVFVIILQHAEHWRVLWFLFMYPVEIPILAILCDRVVGMTGGERRYRKRGRNKK